MPFVREKCKIVRFSFIGGGEFRRFKPSAQYPGGISAKIAGLFFATMADDKNPRRYKFYAAAHNALIIKIIAI